MTDSSHAFESFVRANATALLRTATLLTGTRHAAEDLVQDTLTHLYPRWAAVAAAEVPLAYVRRALTNRFISSRRTRASRDVPVWELPDGWDGSDVSETVALRRDLWLLLGALPERQRAAVVLRYFHDLSDEHIADILGCRPVTVRSFVSRGVLQMRAGLANAGHDGQVR